MDKIKKYFIFFIFFLASLLFFSEQGFGSVDARKYKIGVLVTGEKSVTFKQWAKTAQYLTAHIDDASFEVVLLGFDEIKNAARDKAVDFFIINPAVFVDLEYGYDIERLAIVKNYIDKKPYAYYGSAVFTKKDREDIKSFRDLRWKNVSAVHPQSFGGWLMAYRTFKKEGMNPFEDFKLLKFEGAEANVVHAVLEGNSDAGIVRTGVIEEMVLEGKIDPDQLKVIPVNSALLSDEEKILSDVFPLKHSTRLYPEWIFAKMNTVNIPLAEEVLASLLSIRQDHMAAVVGNYGGWTIPVSYQSVQDCLRALQVSPYDHIGKSALYSVFQRYKPWVITIFFLFFFTVIFALWAAVLNKKLSENTEKLESVFNTIPQAVLGLENRRIMFANKGAQDIFGWPLEELKGKTTAVFYPDEATYENVGSKVHANLDIKDSFTFEEIAVKLDGTKIDCLITVSKMASYTIENRRAVAIYQDITQLKSFLAQIEQQKSFLKEVINSLPHPFFVIDANTYDVKISNSAAQEKKILEGQKCFFVAQKQNLSCSDLSQFCPLDEVKETRKPAVVEHRFEDNGKICYQEVHLYPIFNEKYEVVEVIEYSFDITQRKSAEEDLKKINQILRENEKKLKEMYGNLQKTHKDLESAQTQLVQSEKLASIGQLAAGIAHEINNPTAFIYSNIATFSKYIENIFSFLRIQEEWKKAVDEKNMQRIIDIKKECCDLEKKVDLVFIQKDVRNLLKESKEGLERVQNIVKDLRAFSRSEAEEERTSGNVNEIIDSILSIVLNEMKYKAEIHKEYGNVPLVSCHMQQLGQVFMNILVNASQAIEHKGDIWIRTYSKNNFVYVEIEDSGKGILPQDKGKIFDPFFTTKPVGKGTGLGLSISYEIVKKHNGDIFVESRVGKGSKFIVSLPIIKGT